MWLSDFALRSEWGCPDKSFLSDGGDVEQTLSETSPSHPSPARSNLITGPGMLGLPVAFRLGGWLVAGGMTCAFAALSAVACVMIAVCCRIFKVGRVRSTMAPARHEHALALGHEPHLELETLVRGLGNR